VKLSEQRKANVIIKKTSFEKLFFISPSREIKGNQD
jgi:hypothetical protein